MTIHAPVALAAHPIAPSVAPTPEEVVQFQAAEIRRLEKELSERAVACSTIANTCINLIDRLAAHTDVTRDGGVVIDKQTWERTRGLQLTIETNDKTNLMTVRAREVEKPAPIAFEGRTDA